MMGVIMSQCDISWRAEHEQTDTFSIFRHKRTLNSTTSTSFTFCESVNTLDTQTYVEK